MKTKRMFIPPPPKIFAAVIISASILFSTSCSADSGNESGGINTPSGGNFSVSESDYDSSVQAQGESVASDGEEGAVPITSGALYDQIIQIDPNLSLSESDTCFYLSLDSGTATAKESIRRFFWDIVQAVQLYEIWDAYANMSCTFSFGDNIANVGVSQYEDLYSFTTTHVNVMHDPEVASLFDQFYNAVFGARDISIAQEKLLYDLSKQTGTEGYSIPENYQTGYLWIYSSFGSGCGYTVNENEISVQAVAENSVQGGKQAAQELQAATDSFNCFFQNDSDAMPYTKISVQYIDPSGNITLWDWCSEKNEGSWDVTKNSGATTEFVSGIQSAASEQK